MDYQPMSDAQIEAQARKRLACKEDEHRIRCKMAELEKARHESKTEESVTLDDFRRHLAAHKLAIRNHRRQLIKQGIPSVSIHKGEIPKIVKPNNTVTAAIEEECPHSSRVHKASETGNVSNGCVIEELYGCTRRDDSAMPDTRPLSELACDENLICQVEHEEYDALKHKGGLVIEVTIRAHVDNGIAGHSSNCRGKAVSHG